jgi:hypothetical protein
LPVLTRKRITTKSVIQRVHDSEINGCIGWPIEGRLLIQFGCPLDGIFFGEALVGSYAEAEIWLDEAVQRYAPNSSYTQQAKKLGRPTPQPSVIERLYERGIAGAVMWMYDGAFAASLGDPTNTAPQRSRSLFSWAEAEAWFEREVFGPPAV